MSCLHRRLQLRARWRGAPTTVFTITLSGGRGEFDVEVTECTTRQDGSLWLLTAAEGRRPADRKLTPALILAKGVWASVHTGDVALPDPPVEPHTRPDTPASGTGAPSHSLILLPQQVF